MAPHSFSKITPIGGSQHNRNVQRKAEQLIRQTFGESADRFFDKHIKDAKNLQIMNMTTDENHDRLSQFIERRKNN